MWLNLNPQKQGPSFPFTLVSGNKATASSQTQSVADESSLSPPNGRKIGPNRSRSRPRMSSRPGTNTAIYRKAKASDSAKHIQSTSSSDSTTNENSSGQSKKKTVIFILMLSYVFKELITYEYYN